MIDNKEIFELGKKFAHYPDKWSRVRRYLDEKYDLQLTNNALRKRAKRFEKSMKKEINIDEFEEFLTWKANQANEKSKPSIPDTMWYLDNDDKIFDDSAWENMPREPAKIGAYARYIKVSDLGVTKEDKLKPQTPDYEICVEFTAKNVLVISDLHFPFAVKGWLDFILRVRDKYQCETALSIGDILDQHALSKWVSDPDGYSVGHEIENAIKDVQRLNKEFPDLKVTLGNHDTRHMKAAMNAQLSSRYLRHMNEILDVDWSWHWNFIQNEQVLYTHGDEKGGSYSGHNISKEQGMSSVVGHTHSNAGLHWFRNYNKVWFALNVGCLVDDSGYAMAYGKKNGYKGIQGIGVVCDYGNEPHFIRYTHD